MGLFNNLKEKFGGGEQELTFNYHCRACDTSFETQEKSASRVTCPECGNRDHRKISRI